MRYGVQFAKFCVRERSLLCDRGSDVQQDPRVAPFELYWLQSHVHTFGDAVLPSVVGLYCCSRRARLERLESRRGIPKPLGVSITVETAHRVMDVLTRGLPAVIRNLQAAIRMGSYVWRCARAAKTDNQFRYIGRSLCELASVMRDTTPPCLLRPISTNPQQQDVGRNR